MTQRLAIEEMFSRIQLPTADQLRQLNELVEATQNRPPQGISDLSVNAKAWAALKEVADSFETARANVKVFKEAL